MSDTTGLVIIEDLLDRWRELNRPYEAGGYCGVDDGRYESLSRTAESPLLLTAVHGVRHSRTGVGGKKNDANTAGLVLALGESLPASVATVLRSRPGRGDANSEVSHPIKLLLKEQHSNCAFGALIDVHGMSDEHGFDVAIGLGQKPDAKSEAIAELFARTLSDAGLLVDERGDETSLRAWPSGTMTNWAHGIGLPAIQLEITKRRRSFKAPRTDRAQLLLSLLLACDLIVRNG